MKNNVLIVFLFFWCISSQDAASQTSGQEIIESIIENASDEQDYLHLTEELEFLRSHPINIARPTYGELLKLPLVSPLLAESIILYSDSVPIVTIEQLRSVDLMTDRVLENISPFIIIERPSSNALFFNAIPSQGESRSRIEQRLQKNSGYINNKFLGGRMSSYERLKLSSASLEAAGLFEKDAGESYRNSLTAGYLSLKELGVVKHFVIGNFNVASGQGLVLAKNIASTKGNDAVGQIRKRGRTITPSVSTDEFRYFQGIASHVLIGNFSAAGFYSLRKLPAGINDNGTITSFYTSGNFRTASDLGRQKVLGEQTIGGKLDYTFQDSKNIALTVMNVEYDRQLERTLLDLSLKRTISSGSISWELPMHGLMLFGESATNDLRRYSKIFGIIIPLSKNIAFSYQHRSFSQGYSSPFARPFGERSNISDGELGNYLGIEITANKVTLNAYGDVYSLPSTDNGFGTVGRESFISLLIPITPKFQAMLNCKNKLVSQTNIRLTDDEREQANYRITLQYRATQSVTLVHRIEIVNVTYELSHDVERGLLTFVEGSFKSKEKGWNVKSRFIVFDTDSYNSRLYQYESDVAGNVSNPPLYGKGIRWYVVGGYEFLEHWILSLKYSETKKMNETVLGSGDDEIRGNLDNQVALQLDFQF